MLERSWADDKDPLGTEMPRKQLDGRKSLHGLAQPHLIGDKTAARAHRKQRTFGLVGIQRRPEQLLQRRAAGALMVGGLDRSCSVLCIARLRDEIQGILVATQLMAALPSAGYEPVELPESVHRQDALG